MRHEKGSTIFQLRKNHIRPINTSERVLYTNQTE
nr:MAG TPA: hypothetical protein [Siphoviridae sp. ctgbm9]DAN06922.1 MAG TPA: hypothetical protein [Bacteriophage sp.]DAP08173.1 MAG TPA: hypothetical protein [Caudoviricetes sp.]